MANIYLKFPTIDDKEKWIEYLKEYVESHKRLDVYNSLSLVEVLVLYIATNYYYNRCEYESEIKLGAQLEENRNMKYRSMINASKGIPLI